MMGALGNGRRGGRSPSLLVAALITCILLLGFNYWVSNSRNVELQSKILELEDQMRQLGADKDREQQQSKLKVEEEMRRQLELMEESHLQKQESAQNTWKHEKDALKLNISSSAKAVQEMKNNMKSLMENVKQLKSCQSNLDTLSKKANSEMTQCNKQIEAVKEECNGKVLAAKMDKQKTPEKTPQNDDGSKQKASVSKAKSDAPILNHSNKNMAESPNEKKNEMDPKSKSDAQVLTNELAVEKDEEDAPTFKLTNTNETLNQPNNGDVPEEVVDVKEQTSKDADTVLDEAGILEPKEDDIGLEEVKEDDIKIEEEKEEDAAIGKEDAIMYDNEGEIEKQLSKIKDENQGAGQDLEDELANYNGDDDNQPESEDDKQAQLAGM